VNYRFHTRTRTSCKTADWGSLKAAFGWDVVYLVKGNTGAQVLFRRLPLGFSLLM
jgi:hypothetical protein